jgi:methylase of polypeptide subunit release factors
MRALSTFAPEQAAKIRFLLTDIDDTLTTEGRLTAGAYAALAGLSAAGITVIPITGRPAGWCDHIARMWPVFAIVGENGAFYMRYDHNRRRMLTHHFAGADERRANRTKLDALSLKILTAVPGCALASDQTYREADLAIDFCEDVERLPESAIKQIVSSAAACLKPGGWLLLEHGFDQAPTTRHLLAEAGFEYVQSRKDLAGIERCSGGQKAQPKLVQ